MFIHIASPSPSPPSETPPSSPLTPTPHLPVPISGPPLSAEQRKPHSLPPHPFALLPVFCFFFALISPVLRDGCARLRVVCCFAERVVYQNAGLFFCLFPFLFSSTPRTSCERVLMVRDPITRAAEGVNDGNTFSLFSSSWWGGGGGGGALEASLCRRSGLIRK